MTPRRSIVAFGTLLLVGCGGPGHPPPHQPRPDAPRAAGPKAPAVDSAGSIAGEYTLAHEVMMVCDDEDGCAQGVTDTMVLEATPAGRLSAYIELYATNAHSCTFENEMTQKDRHTWIFEEEGEDGEDLGCRLTLTQSDTTIDLTSDGCRDYCGVRAVLEASFPYPPKPLAP